MKSLSVKLGVILVVGLAIFAHAEVGGTDWRPVQIDDTVIVSYDAEGITRLSKDMVTVWVRIEYTEKGIMKKVQSQGRQWENVGYVLVLYEINCKDKLFHYLSTTYYSGLRKVLYSDSYSSEWDFIRPKTVGEILYKAVCK